MQVLLVNSKKANIIGCSIDSLNKLLYLEEKEISKEQFISSVNKTEKTSLSNSLNQSQISIKYDYLISPVSWQFWLAKNFSHICNIHQKALLKFFNKFIKKKKTQNIKDKII